MFTGADLNGDVVEAWVDFEGGDGGRPFRVLADGDVRFVGEPVALVVAESRYIAEDACDLVEVDIEPIDAIVGHDAALAAGRATRARRARRNIAGAIPAVDDPELDAIFASAAHVVTETFHQHRYLCVPMECRGVVSLWDGFRNELVVHTSTQGAHGVRGFLSRALGLPENRVRVVMGDVGGGFGQKMFMLPDELGVVLAGKLLGRPVKWIEDRRENLMAGQHARNDRMTVSVALDADGHILGARGDLVEDVGAFPAAGSSAIGFVGLLFTGPYKIPKLGLLGHGRLHEHVRALLVPRAVDDGDRRPRADDGHGRPAPRHRSPGAAAPQRRRRGRPAVHDGGRHGVRARCRSPPPSSRPSR